MPLRFPELCMPFPSTQQQAYMTYIQLWKHPRYTELFQFSQGTKTGPVSAISQFSQTHTVHILYMRPTKMKQCKGLITEHHEQTIFENYKCHTKTRMISYHLVCPSVNWPTSPMKFWSTQENNKVFDFYTCRCMSLISSWSWSEICAQQCSVNPASCKLLHVLPFHIQSLSPCADWRYSP